VARTSFEIGLVFSTTGPYAALGRSALAGAQMALKEVNGSGRVRLTARVGDPRGIPNEYDRITADILADGEVRQIVGGITSWSRKDMIPVLERMSALLWYPCPYEGFESNDHVVYLGACPNQHLVPLLDHAARLGARRAALVGSNYVWGWETLRLARERLGALGIEVTAERYLPLGATYCSHVVEEFAGHRPDLVVNSLIGPSNHAFMAALHAAEPGNLRVVIANQTEADLADLGDAAEGMLSQGAWFEGASFSPPGFAEAAQLFCGPEGRVSCFFATAYTAVRLLAGGLAECGTDDPRLVFDAVSARWHETPLGRISIDRVTRHTSLTPCLAEVRGARFRILHEAEAPIAADPYLTHVPAPAHAAPGGLRVVS
jgi:branched-chain amino acid transport system substrate-binding protein